jgi:hypothetical protein
MGWEVLRRGSEPRGIVVPERTCRRARRIVQSANPTTWVDQTLYLIGSNLTHHRPGDPLLDEAVASAEALLALLVEMRRAEQ